ncbi:MAG: hypothetical protein IJZ10_12175 [Thermoguttaceae bacterium]|nr:hypothetical protein [Thermoguttaceae bacterium]
MRSVRFPRRLRARIDGLFCSDAGPSTFPKRIFAESLGDESRSVLSILALLTPSVVSPPPQAIFMTDQFT